MVKNVNTLFSITIFLSLIAISLILSFGRGFSLLTLEGINLWLALILPAMLPYFFITAVLSSLSITSKISGRFSPLTTRLFNTSGACGYAFFMSLIAGYPIGAKIVCDLRESGAISDSEGVRASTFCSTSSPMFLINSVGVIMFNSTAFGLILLVSNFLSAIIIGIIFSNYKKSDKPINKPFISSRKIDNILYESAYSSVISVLVVGAIITIFYILSSLLFHFNILTPIIKLFALVLEDFEMSKALTFGLIESTRGLKVLSTLPISVLTLPLCAFICGFGGLSVIMQSIAYLKKAKIKTAPFIKAKLLCAVLNFLITLIICLIFQPI